MTVAADLIRSELFSGTFFECMGLYLGIGITNVDLEMLNRLRFVDITLFFNGAAQQIVQRYQIADPWRPINITISAI